MGGQFPPEWRWSACSGILPESVLFTGGQFPPESGGQFDRILHQYVNNGMSRFKVPVDKLIGAWPYLPNSLAVGVAGMIDGVNIGSPSSYSLF